MTEQVEELENQEPTQILVKDDKNIITQVAFTVDEALLGKQLATPTQRGIAILVDAFFVALLTNVSAVFWSLFAGIAFFKAGKQQKNKSWRITRWVLRFSGAIVIFVAALAIFSSYFGDDYYQSTSDWEKQATVNIDENNGEQFKNSIADVVTAGLLTKNVIQLESLNEDGDCKLDCLQSKSVELVSSAAKLNMGKVEIADMLANALADNSNISPQEKEQLIEQSTSSLDVLSKDKEPVKQELVDQESIAQESQEENAEQPSIQVQLETLQQENEQLKNKEVNYSLIDFVKTQIEDLGLGFGWAALYFTAFSAWWRGQTPGKKLMGIRVIQLDGSYMSAWESFGRYGGYGAGFATGLLGFVQIVWDSNRQAIQDKISATVVIKGDL